MFLLGKNLGNLLPDEDYDYGEKGKNDELNTANGNNRMKLMSVGDSHWTSGMDRSLRHNYTEYVINGPNKVFKNEDPVAMLPTALIDALIVGKDTRIHHLEAEISSVQEEFEKAKIIHSNKLKKLWSLNRSNTKQSKVEREKNELHRPTSAPELQWGRRKQLVSLLASQCQKIHSVNNSRELLFPLTSHEKFSNEHSNISPVLKNDLQIQLWMWMERVNDVENELLHIEDERDSIEEELQKSIEESKALENQLNSLKINQAQEKVKTLKMKEELERLSKYIVERKEKFDKTIQSKDDELHCLKNSFTAQTETLSKLQEICYELKERNEFLERDKREKGQLLLKIEVLDDELRERQAILEDLKKDANKHAKELALSKENFDCELKRWKLEVNGVRQEILRVERERDQSLAEIEKLKVEVYKLQSKCTELEQEKLSILSHSQDQGNLVNEKEHLQLEVSKLNEQLKVAEMQFDRETKARIALEIQMESMNANTLTLEKKLSHEAESYHNLQSMIGTMQNAFEAERKNFKENLEQLIEKYSLERQEEKVKTQKLLEELEEEKKLTLKCQFMLEEEIKKRSDSEEKKTNYKHLEQERVKLVAVIESEKAMRNEMEMKVHNLNEELSSEKLKLKEINDKLDEEIKKSEKMHQVLLDSAKEVLQKELFIKSLKDDLLAKEDLEIQLEALTNELSASNRIRETLQYELEEKKVQCDDLAQKCDKLIFDLSDEKNHSSILMESFNRCKENLKARMRALDEQIENKSNRNNEEFMLRKQLEKNIEDLSDKLDVERERQQTLLSTMEAQNLKLKNDVETLMVERKLHEEKLNEVEQCHNEEVKRYTSEIEKEKCDRLKAEEKAENYQQKINEMNHDHSENIKELKEEFEKKCKETNLLEVERERIQTLLSTTEVHNLKLKNDVENLAVEVKQHEEKLNEIELCHNEEVKKFTSEIEKEKFDRLKAEEKAENYQIKINEMNKDHSESMKQLKEELEKKYEEANKLHANEVKKLKENEMRLIKEKESYIEDLNYMVNQGPSGDGVSVHSSGCYEREEQEKMKGMANYYQRLIDEMCSQNAARETAIRRRAEMDISNLYQEMMLLHQKMDDEKAAHETAREKLENDLKEAQLLLSTSADHELNEKLGNTLPSGRKCNQDINIGKTRKNDASMCAIHDSKVKEKIILNKITEPNENVKSELYNAKEKIKDPKPSNKCIFSSPKDRNDKGLRIAPQNDRPKTEISYRVDGGLKIVPSNYKEVSKTLALAKMLSPRGDGVSRDGSKIHYVGKILGDHEAKVITKKFKYTKTRVKITSHDMEKNISHQKISGNNAITDNNRIKNFNGEVIKEVREGGNYNLKLNFGANKLSIPELKCYSARLGELTKINKKINKDLIETTSGRKTVENSANPNEKPTNDHKNEDSEKRILHSHIECIKPTRVNSLKNNGLMGCEGKIDFLKYRSYTALTRNTKKKGIQSS